MKLVTAKKEHRCTECGRKIAIGERYWRDYIEDIRDGRVHTNCAEHEKEPELPEGFNQNRRAK